MIKVVAAMNRFVELPKSTLFSIQIFAPRIPIIPYSATPTPPRTPGGVALRTAPNLGESDNKIAPTPATQ